MSTKKGLCFTTGPLTLGTGVHRSENLEFKGTESKTLNSLPLILFGKKQIKNIYGEMYIKKKKRKRDDADIGYLEM